MEYTLIRSDRKTVSIQIKPDGTILVRAPRRMARQQIEVFVRSKSDWIEKHLSAMPYAASPPLSEEELSAIRKKAREIITARVSYFAPIVGVGYGRISIRTQRTRWGSCSAQGNLNFNALLALAPEEVVDYVVVHELCHRREMNHSERFWSLVEDVLPEYRGAKGWLKDNGGALLARLGEY